MAPPLLFGGVSSGDGYREAMAPQRGTVLHHGGISIFERGENLTKGAQRKEEEAQEDPRVQRTIDLIQFNRWHDAGKRVVGYGAPAKASTWLHYMGLTSYNIECIMDSTPEKIGKFTPGSHIPIVAPNLAWLASSDIVVILAWNWAAEILPKIPEGPEVWARGERLR